MLCVTCNHAQIEYLDYIGDYKVQYIAGCHEGLEPHGNECEGYEPEEGKYERDIQHEHILP